MISVLTAFFTSFIATLLIIRTQKLHGRISGDQDFDGPQKFHTNIVPRIGGISIAVGLFFSSAIRAKNIALPSVEIFLLTCAIPTFAIGLTEDLTKKISVRLRLLLTAISATLVIHFLQIEITRLGTHFLDLIFIIPGASFLLTVIAITGLANAYNIIDGFNGLASMVGALTLLAIAYVSFLVGDVTIIFLSLIMVGAILGFFIWNYPRGLIFLGDGGAYLIGFWIATLSIMLIYKHQEISPWFALLINGYPIVETLFTIYRRKIHQGKSPGQPDGIHFHTLIYRRILNPVHNSENLFSANAKTAPYLWCLTILSITPVILWWQSTTILIFAMLGFVGFYVWLYKCIVQFKTPKWLRLS